MDNGVMNITAVKDGIHANDYITLDGKNINITVNAQGDGIESEGYLTVDKATLNLSGGGKGLIFAALGLLAVAVVVGATLLILYLTGKLGKRQEEEYEDAPEDDGGPYWDD